MPLDEAIRFAETLRVLVEEKPFEFEGHTMNVTISLGVATATDREPVSAFVKAADENLYRAKNSGRNRVVG